MRDNLLKGFSFLTISSFIFMFSGYLANIWLGRSLGPLNYGVYGVIISLMSLVNIIQTSGLTQSASKYIAEDEKNADGILQSALHLQLIITFVMTVLFFVLANPIATLLKDPQLIPYIRLTALVFPMYGLFALFIDYYNGRHFFKKQAILNSIYSISKLICILIFSLIWGLKGALIAFIVAPFIALLYGFHLPKKVKQTFPYNKLLFFSAPLVGFVILYILQQSIDLYFIKALNSSATDPGYYTANQNIAKIPLILLSALASVLFPSISRSLSRNEIKQIRSLIHKSLRLVLILIIPGTFLISVTSDQVISFLYSEIYLPAAPSLSILIFASGFLTIFTTLANILNGAGEPKKSLWIAGLGVAITAFSCLFMVPKYGLIGAAASTTLGSFVSMIIAAYFVYQRFQALVSISRVSKILFSSFVIYFMAKAITIPLLLLPFLYIFLFAIYIVILIVLKEITSEDWKQVKSLMPSWVPFVN